MTSVSPSSSSSSSHKAAQEKEINPYPNIKESTAARKELIGLARRTFSDLMFTASSEENLPNLEKRYASNASILKEKIEEAKKIENVNDIAHLVFGSYLDVEIEASLPLIHEKFPKLNELPEIDNTLREEFRARAHMLYGTGITGMEDPIIKAIREVLKDKNFGDIRLDLRKQL